MRVFRLFAVLALLIFAGVGLKRLYASWPPIYTGEAVEVRVRSSAIPLDSSDPARTRVGRLEYRGGVVIKADDRHIGGLSDMLWDAECGRFLTVSDTGLWVVIEPEEREGWLTGVSRMWMAAIRDTGGQPTERKRDADAEGLMRSAPDELLVWFEQDHRARRYTGVSACRPESLNSAARDELRPPEMQAWPKNGGAEAVAMQGDDMLILSEAHEVAGGTDALAIAPDGSTRQFVYTAPGDTSPTAMAAMDADNSAAPMLILHRHFSLLQGVSAVLGLAHIDADSGEPVQPEILGEFRSPVAVDNFEALAVRPEGDRRFIYLLSDDNFNPFQQTLLLKFELLPE
ncbi:MAG: esterase-like activity of phytase family protein [Sphingomonadaceae bacterium]